ncbi:hypothetical protein TWF481_003103 [Arthrobotrys musiformis]|uniref:Uncharacterized protein n=1 Tax=Arthrobotrys musiformis TaxID=47236 RepID=A0AAV9VPA1_9PEZI
MDDIRLEEQDLDELYKIENGPPVSWEKRDGVSKGTQGETGEEAHGEETGEPQMD